MILIFKTSAEGEDHRGYSSREQRTSQVQQQLCRIIGNYSQDRKPNEVSVLCDKTVNKSKGPLLSMWPLANLGWSRHWPYNPSLAPRRDQHCIKSTQGYLITNVRLQRLVFLRRKVTSFISHFLIYFGWLFTLHGPIITLNGRDGGSIIVNWSPLSPQWSTDPSPFFPPVSANSRTFASINSICFYPVNL